MPRRRRRRRQTHRWMADAERSWMGRRMNVASVACSRRLRSSAVTALSSRLTSSRSTSHKEEGGQDHEEEQEKELGGWQRADMGRGVLPPQGRGLRTRVSEAATKTLPREGVCTFVER